MGFEIPGRHSRGNGGFPCVLGVGSSVGEGGSSQGEAWKQKQNLLEKDGECGRERLVKFGPVLFGRAVTRPGSCGKRSSVWSHLKCPRET